MKTALAAQSWESLEAAAGTSRDEMLRFARMTAEAKSAVFVWSMGITQHRHGVANVRAIADLALARGFVGREKCGLMAIRGHSGVQGGAEVGAVPNQFPGGVAVGPEGAAQFARLWGFDVPDWTGLNAVADDRRGSRRTARSLLPDRRQLSRDPARNPITFAKQSSEFPFAFIKTSCSVHK